MNVALRSVGESLSPSEETKFLQYRTGARPMTWNQSVEVLLVT